jgi:hypothetical protein
MTSWKPVINLLVSDYCLTCLNFLKICSKKLVEEIFYLFETSNLIQHLLLQLSTLWRWQESCGVECWGLRPPISKCSYFSPKRCLEIVRFDLVFFLSFVRIHHQASHWHCSALKWQLWHDKFVTHFISFFLHSFFYICLSFLKILLKWLAKEMI